MRKILCLIVLIGAFIGTSLVHAGSIGRQDFHNWDGDSGSCTFTRTTSGGYTITLNDVNSVADILMTHGGGVNYNRATVNSALTTIGSTDGVGMLFNPGTWSFSSGITIPGNIACLLPSGVTLQPAAGVTVWIEGSVIAGNYSVFDVAASGSSVILLGNALGGVVYDNWYGETTERIGFGKQPQGPYKYDFAGGGRFEGNLATESGTITGGILVENYTTSTTLSGQTLYGGFIGNLGAASEVTVTIPAAADGMNFMVSLRQNSQSSGASFFLVFNTADSINELPDFTSSTTALMLSGSTGEVKRTFTYAGPNRWEMTGVSGAVTYRNQ